ncbi:hypothetical protein BE04_20765 [Sorangium cellulosum]|uniref:Uncharacterized protein n=2 Tax=Sorangium cellulosum TaxID=56 RepID=A0A150P503_SORCE|nr:hypothetical protein [Sorangium cellulosum]AGP34367.1 hypothetical protein SCE1572_07515 [Sorangium cellulosum So0157-2]KYF50737.1 hypothetical protein BE04_20765 [Sorangium cellulosum]
MKLRCFVNGTPADSRSLTRRSMNFGQGCPGLPAHACRIEAETGGFLTAIRGQFDQLREELVTDLPHDAESEEVRALQALNWPALEDLLRLDEGLLARVLSTYLIQEVLDTLLPHRLEELIAPAYSIDSVSTLQVNPALVRLDGIAYPLAL